MDISGDLLRYGKRDNSHSASKAKVGVRERVLEAIGADKARVFDAFAGEGTMHREVWCKAAGYTGCDTDWFKDGRLAYVGDNRRVMRAIDLGQFNVFDFDSYGSPWEQVTILAARRPLQPGEVLGMVLTEGLGLKMNMGGVSKAFAKLARIKYHMPGMGAAREEIIERALREVCRRMHAKIKSRWQADGNKGSRVSYMGLVLTSD